MNNTRKEFETWFEAEQMPCESDWFTRDVDDKEEYLNNKTVDSWDGWNARQSTIDSLNKSIVDLEFKIENERDDLYKIKEGCSLLLLNILDCRTCLKFTGKFCSSIIKCINGNLYCCESSKFVKLWDVVKD